MDDDKQKLLDELLDSVKNCQVRFGGKSELATESEEVIANLCLKFEAILYHGLKTPEQPSATAFFKDLVANNIHSLVGANSQYSGT